MVSCSAHDKCLFDFVQFDDSLIRMIFPGEFCHAQEIYPILAGFCVAVQIGFETSHQNICDRCDETGLEAQNGIESCHDKSRAQTISNQATEEGNRIKFSELLESRNAETRTSRRVKNRELHKALIN